MNEDGNFILDETVDIEFQLNQNEESHGTPQNTQAENLKFEVLASGDTDEASQDNKFAIKPRQQKNTGSNNSSAVLFEISKQRTEYQERKLELETKKYETQFELENKKLSLEEKRIDNEFKIQMMAAEARKLEAENRRLELMSRYPSGSSDHHNFIPKD